jgi:UDPglucose 6-dehydrogenase
MKTANRILNMIVPILGPNKTYHMTTAIAAEIAKYMENSYLATKIVFCYEFEQICTKFDVPYHMVRECWLLDPRIGSSHTAIFTSNITPYSGKCLPKDVKAIIASSTEKGYVPQFLIDVDASNTRIGNLRQNN